MNWYTVVLVISAIALDNVNSDKILAVLPTPSKSHWILAQNLLLELARSGHEITVISPFPLKSPPKNYRDIETIEIKDIMENKIRNLLNELDIGPFKKLQKITDMGFSITNFTLSHQNVKKLLANPNEKFDLIFLEVFLTEAMLGFGHFYNAPIVAMSTVGATTWVSNLLGSPRPLSYIPNTFMGLTDKMSYKDRMTNAVVSTFEIMVTNSIMSDQRHLYEKTFPDPKPDFNKVLQKSVSVALLNSHFSLSIPQPLLPNTIEVGGMHVNTISNPLPNDLKQFIESAEHGVIYFSMGSNIIPSTIPRDILDQVFKALLTTKQKVLWKWDEPEFFVQNNQILIRKWFPQDDILAHPNVKLFITHGGLLSCTEAIYHGVPVIGIPIFGDQHMNMARVVSSGLGIQVDYKNLTESSLTWALNEMALNKKYLDKVKLTSEIFRDRPITALETAKFWVEYVLRHRGAPHLHSTSQDLSFIQYHMIDVWFTIAAIVVLFLCLDYLLVKIVKKKLLKIIDKKKKNN